MEILSYESDNIDLNIPLQLLQHNSGKITALMVDMHLAQPPQYPIANAQYAIDGDIAGRGSLSHVDTLYGTDNIGLTSTL